MAGLSDALYCRLRYDAEEYDFAGLVETMIGEASLSEISGDGVPLRRRETDQKTRWHSRYYALFGEALGPMYRHFIRKEIAPLFPEPVYYQAVPSLRIHLPGNVAVGEFHRDTDYGHPAEEVNFWMPLALAEKSAAPLVEDDDGERVSLQAEIGEIIVFDAANRLHGNVVNTTGRSRVSLDFRVLPVSAWRETAARTVNAGLRFVPGSFYAAEPA